MADVNLWRLLNEKIPQMNCDPYKIVRDFEAALCEYTGAKYAVTTNSCTMALLLAVAWHLRGISPILSIDEYGSAIEIREEIVIPAETYQSVPFSILHAGGRPTFRSEKWSGTYQLFPLPVYDCARRFTSGMFIKGQFQCVSFHASKILGDTQGGAILHDNYQADAWLRRARFDGRTESIAPKDDNIFERILSIKEMAWHCYMSNDVAARLLLKLYSLPEHNADLPNDDYPDLSKIGIFNERNS